MSKDKVTKKAKSETENPVSQTDDKRFKIEGEKTEIKPLEVKSPSELGVGDSDKK